MTQRKTVVLLGEGAVLGGVLLAEGEAKLSGGGVDGVRLLTAFHDRAGRCVALGSSDDDDEVVGVGLREFADFRDCVRE